MNEPRTDDERLAALLDGRLSEGERQALLAELAASSNDYHVFADAAAVLQDLEDAEQSAEAAPEPVRAAPAPPSTRTPAWRTPARWAGLGAAVAVLVLGTLWISRVPASGAPDTVRLAERVDPSGRGLPPDWPGPERWDPARGSEVVTAQTAKEKAAQGVQAGVLLVDLAVTARARDIPGTRQLATQTASRLEPRSGSGTPLRRIADRPGAPFDSLNALLTAASDRLAHRLGQDPFQLGAWCEAARLAAHRHDAAFFREEPIRAALQRAAPLTERDPAARAALDRARAAAAAEPLDWDALEHALDTLIRALGR